MKFGIAARLNVVIIFILAGFYSFLGLYFTNTQKKIIESSMSARIHALISNLAVNSEYPVLIKNKAAIRKLVKGMLQQEDIIYCSVEDKSGTVLYEEGSGGKNGIPQPEDIIYCSVDDAHETILHEKRSGKEKAAAKFISAITTDQRSGDEEFLFGITGDRSVKETIGKTTVMVTFANLKKEIAAMQKVVLLVIFFCMAATSLASSLLLRLILGGPIRQLSLGTKKIASGDLNYKVSLTTADELGSLAADFNKMTENLEATTVSRDKLTGEIAERRRAEKALLKSEKKYRNLIEATRTGFLILDGRGRVVDANAEYVRLSGHRGLDEILGRCVIEWTAAHSREKNAAAVARCIRDGIIQGLEIDYTGVDGRNIPVEINATVEGTGEDLRIISLCRDITDRVKLETQMRQSEKMGAVGQLAAGVAHEINNPLGIILGFAQSVVKKIKEDDPLALPLKTIEREAVRCKNLVQNLLVFSRTSKSSQLEKVDINAAVESSLSLISTRTKTCDVELVREPGADLPGIRANNNQLQQVVVNLANNAIDAMPEGGTLTVRTALSARRPGHVEIRVGDTGAGIPKELREKIFDPFFTTKEAGKGTGLGLSLVYEIVHKHGGTIELESEEGKGTTFTVFLPVHSTAPEASL